MSNRREKIIALLLGTGFFFLLIVLAEIILRVAGFYTVPSYFVIKNNPVLLNKYYTRLDKKKIHLEKILAENTNYSSTDFYNPEPGIIGNGFRKNYSTIAVKKVDGEIVFRANYHTDDFGRRVVLPKIPSADSFSAFFGGSRVFGQGVNNEDTLPSQFQKISKKQRVYNYGITGHGPLALLAYLKFGELEKQISEKSGDFFLIIESDLHLRIRPSSARPYMLSYPCFKIDKNRKMQYRGSYLDCEPIWSRLILLMAHSAVAQNLKLHFPFWFSTDLKDFTLSVVEEIQSEIQSRYPKANFYVVSFYPTELSNFFQKLAEKKIKNISCDSFNATQEIKKNGLAIEIPKDGHPTDVVHKLHATALYRTIYTSSPEEISSVCKFDCETKSKVAQ